MTEAGGWLAICWKRADMRRDAGCVSSATHRGARQVDFQGDTIIDLTTQEEAVLIDLTPYELARVEMTLG